MIKNVIMWLLVRLLSSYIIHFYYSYTASGQLKNLMKDISSYKSCFTVAARDEGCFKINELSFGIDLTSYVKRSQCW